MTRHTLSITRDYGGEYFVHVSSDTYRKLLHVFSHSNIMDQSKIELCRNMKLVNVGLYETISIISGMVEQIYE